MRYSVLAGTLGVIAMLFWLNRRYPLRRETALILPRLITNIILSLLAFAAVIFVVEPSIKASLGWSESRQIGLLKFFAVPDIAAVVLAFLWFDCTFYLWHRLNHVWPFLWRFHNVHHIDPDLDVSTSFRFHFGEIILSSLFRVLQIAIIGPSFLAYLIYEGVFQLGTMFHHSNLRLPLELERPLSRLIVTPRMHGIHHSEIREENRSNFSVVLSMWDRVFSTLRLNIPQEKVKIGIPAYTAADNGIVHALTLPFVRQREYWRSADGNLLLERPETLPGSRSELVD